MPEIRLGVHGSRTLNDERVKIILMEEIKNNAVTKIVTHGEPEGVCGVARKLCRELAIPLELHFLNFKYLRGAFEHRSIDVVRNSDVAVLIHDGVSKGTSNELKLIKKMKRKFKYYEIEPTQHKVSVGFEPEDWGSSLTDADELLKT